MAKRKVTLLQLARKIDITPSNLSILKTGKARAIRFSTLNNLCRILDCSPGDILEYVTDEEAELRFNNSLLLDDSNESK